MTATTNSRGRLMRSFVLSLLLSSLTLAARAQNTTPPISLDGRIYLAENTQQSANPDYYRPVAPQAQQAPCGGFSTPPCTGQTTTPTGPTAEQLFFAAKQADANHQPEQSIAYLTRSAKMGYRKAQYALGIDYQKGNGVPQDLKQAEYWLDLASQQGSNAAQQAAAVIDPAKAMHFLQEAADKHDPQSEFDLAMDYELGHGVAHNRALAIQYFRAASRDGGRPTGIELATILTHSSPARRFASQDALIATLPQAPAPPPVPAGCPTENSFISFGAFPKTETDRFCYQNPNCPIHIEWGNKTWDYRCDPSRYNWK